MLDPISLGILERFLGVEMRFKAECFYNDWSQAMFRVDSPRMILLSGF